ncbi:MAG: PDZ domain-containing protein [Gemmatimonadota bacterium]|jgi:hypothetical protein
MRKRTNAMVGAGVARSVMIAAAAVAAVAAAVPAAAQEEPEECRCVDASGQEIENCRCFTMPRLDLNRGFALSLGFPRARIGVRIGGDEGNEDRRGVVIREVVEGSPADEAGLQEGDVVTRVDGHSVLEPLEDEEEERQLDPSEAMAVQRFVRLVGDLEPGEEASLEYLRDGEARRTTVVPESARSLFGTVTPGGHAFLRSGPDTEWEFFSPEGMRGRVFSFDPDVHPFEEGEGPLGAWTFGEGDHDVRVFGGGLDPCVFPRSGEGVTVIAGSRCVDGLQLQDLSAQLAEYFGVDRGVLVVQVAENATLGLRAGDVIRAIGGRDVEDVADVRRILSSYEGDENVEVTIVRRGETMAVRGTRR